jgi:enamine deaminase RidA (YjgF/YER057c/UK114 family)
MARTLLSSGSSFETDIGYSRAVIDGDWIFVSGTSGFDYATMTIPDDVVAQCKQAMRNIASVLSQAGASMADTYACATYCQGVRTSSRVGRC